MDKASAEDKAKKVRSLLASYYTDDGATDLASDRNLLDGSGSPSRPRPAPLSLSPAMPPASSGAGAGSSLLDASYFDADAYLKRLIKGSRLEELAAQHHELVAEVGALDQDMQTLVYENYSKFIAATDTIREMNGEMAGLDGRIRSLDGLIGGVVERSHSVNGKLEQRQESLEELAQGRALLAKLQALFEVPARLRAAIDAGALDVAAETYAAAAPVLSKHGHRAALRGVAAQAEACRAEVASRLRGQLLSRPEGAAESIQLIAALGEPTESLQDDFLECQRARLLKVLKTAEAAMAAGPATADLAPALVQLDSAFVSELGRTAALFDELFDPGSRPRLVKDAREALQLYSQLVRKALAAAADAAAAAAANAGPSGRARGGAKSALVAEDWGAAALLRVLGVVRGDLPRLETLLPEVGARDKAAEVVGNAVRHHVGACFAALEARAAGEAQALLRQLGAAVSEAALLALLPPSLESMEELLLVGCERLLSDLGEYTKQRWALDGWHDVFAGLVQAQADNMLRALPRQFAALASSSADGAAAPPALALLLARLCAFMDRHLASRVTAQVDQLAGRRQQLLSHVSGGQELRQYLATAAAALLDRYARAHGAALAGTVRREVDSTDWMEHPEAQEPSPACTILLQRLAAVEAQLAAVGDAAAEAQASSVPHSRQSSASLEGSYASSIGTGQQPQQQLEQQQQGATPSRADILAAVLLEGLRAQAAALRRHSLGRAAFQQCQLDCHFLRPQLQRAVAGAAGGHAALQALEEVLVAAAESCGGGAVLLEPAALDKLIADAQQRRGGGS